MGTLPLWLRELVTRGAHHPYPGRAVSDGQPAFLEKLNYIKCVLSPRDLRGEVSEREKSPKEGGGHVLPSPPTP